MGDKIRSRERAFENASAWSSGLRLLAALATLHAEPGRTIWRFQKIAQGRGRDHRDATPPRSEIRAVRAGDAADGKILAHQAGIIGVGVHALACGALAHRVAEAPAARQHAALVGLRGG